MEPSLIVTLIFTACSALFVHFFSLRQMRKEYEKKLEELAKKHEEKLDKLNSKCHDLEIKQTQLEGRDNLQEQVINQIPNIFGVVNRLIDAMPKKGEDNGNGK